jgi:hypothetical protein
MLKVEEKPVFQKRLENLIFFIACGGNEIKGFKNLKSSFFLLDKKHNIAKYDWNLDLFGPHDLDFFGDLEDLLFRENIYRNLSISKGEPIHHSYSLTAIGEDRLTDLVRTTSRSDDAQFLSKFLTEAIAWLSIPLPYSLSKSLVEAEIEERKNTLDIELERRFKKISHPSDHFKGYLDDIFRYYKSSGLKMKIFSNNDDVTSLIGIPQDFVKRYSYLQIKEPLKTPMVNLNGLFNSVYSFYLFKKYGLVTERGMRETLDEICLNIRKNHQKLQKANEEMFKLLNILCAITYHGDGENLYLRVGRESSELCLTKDSKDLLKKRFGLEFKPEYYLYYWHILQPYELRDALKYWSVNELLRLTFQ